MYYSRQGQGLPVVLVHGLSGSSLWWRRNVPVLAREFTVYTVDLVGFGQSGRQPVLPLKGSAALLANWLETLGLSKARLIGHSLGGQTALHLAARGAERLEGLVLVAASALASGRWWRMAALLPQAGLAGAADFLPTLAFDAARAGPLNLYRATREILRDDPKELLAALRLPTLLVWGERDVLIPGAMGRQMQQAIAGSRLVVIPGAGHNVMYDRAAAFNAAVLPFLRRPQEPGPGPAPEAP